MFVYVHFFRKFYHPKLLKVSHWYFIEIRLISTSLGTCAPAELFLVKFYKFTWILVKVFKSTRLYNTRFNGFLKSFPRNNLPKRTFFNNAPINSPVLPTDVWSRLILFRCLFVCLGFYVPLENFALVWFFFGWVSLHKVHTFPFVSVGTLWYKWYVYLELKYVP